MAPKVTEEYKLETRDKILEAAEVLFSKKGYYDTSMDEIVKQSGLSKGGIYEYFSSKEDLFLALKDKRVQSSLNRLNSTFGPSDSPMSKLEKAADIVFTSMVGSSKEACRMSLEFSVLAPRIKSLQRARDNQLRALHDFVFKIVKEGVDGGEFRNEIDPDSAACIIVGMVDGLSFDWATTTFDFDWALLKKQSLELFTKGLISNKPRRG
jgi:AcrR family transcriptional regulator